MLHNQEGYVTYQTFLIVTRIQKDPNFIRKAENDIGFRYSFTLSGNIEQDTICHQERKTTIYNSG
jgi:hypothetical protein